MDFFFEAPEAPLLLGQGHGAALLFTNHGSVAQSKIFSLFSYSKTMNLYLRLPHRWHCLDFFLPPHDAAGIRTYGHVSRVALTRDLQKDALPTELIS